MREAITAEGQVVGSKELNRRLNSAGSRINRRVSWIRVKHTMATVGLVTCVAGSTGRKIKPAKKKNGEDKTTLARTHEHLSGHHLASDDAPVEVVGDGGLPPPRPCGRHLESLH